MKKTFLRHAVLALTILFSGTAARAAGDEWLASPPVHQLRIYHIEGENREAFHERFREHAARIMAEYGFEIVAMWESHFDDRTEFVYLLEWPDREAMTSAWEAFMADEEWARIKRETSRVHGTFVHAIEDRTLVLTSYSPGVSLLGRSGEGARPGT